MKFSPLLLAYISLLSGCVTPQQIQQQVARDKNLTIYHQSAVEQDLCRQGLANSLPAGTKIVDIFNDAFAGFIDSSPIPEHSAGGYDVTTAAGTGIRNFYFSCAIQYVNGAPIFSSDHSLIGQRGQAGSFKPLPPATTANAPQVATAMPPTVSPVQIATIATTASLEARAEPFKARLASAEGNQQCIDYIADNLLDPTSFKLTSNFEPDPLWLAVPDSSEPNEIRFSAKMLARNKGGNIAPARAICYYNT